MKTKLILHGGILTPKNESNDLFFKEFTSALNDGDTALWIGFARRDEDKRQEIYERDKGLILAQADKKIDVINATYENLIEQCKKSSAVFITGGETDELVKDIQKYPDFIESIDGKTVAGSSAGACLFATKYFYCQEQGILDGLGTLPISLLVHYGSEEYNATDEALELLKACSDNLDVITLEECEWKVIEAEI